MDVDKVAEKIDKLTEKIKALNYPFVDMDLHAEAVESLDGAVASLETYLDLVTRDGDENPNEEEND